MDVDEAKDIGIKVCIEKIGYDFCRKYVDNAISGYSEAEGVFGNSQTNIRFLKKWKIKDSQRICTFPTDYFSKKGT